MRHKLLVLLAMVLVLVVMMLTAAPTMAQPTPGCAKFTEHALPKIVGSKGGVPEGFGPC